jgi:hypothetical protein
VVVDVIDDKKIIVDLIPPIPGFVYGKVDDVDLVILAARYAGVALSPMVSEWPCTVNICLPKEKDGWKSGPWDLIDIGEITQDGTTPGTVSDADPLS